MKIFIFFLVLFSCADQKQVPKIEKGVLDLRNWNFEEEIELRGEFEFYFNELLTEEDFLKQREKIDYLQIPKIWNEFEYNGKKVGSFGFATYRLKILFPENSPPLAMKASQQATSFSIQFLDQIFGSGKVGKTKEESIPVTIPQVFYFSKSNSTEKNLIMQVSNFTHRKGGTWANIYLGTHNQISKLVNISRNTEYFFTGFFLFVIIYHIGFYYFRKKEKVLLAYALFSFAVLLRAITTEDKILTDIKFFSNYEILIRLEYLGSFLAPAFVIHFIYLHFPNEVPKKLVNFMYSVAIISVLFLLSPIYYFSHAVIYYQIILVLTPLMLNYYILKAVMHLRDYAFPIIIGGITILCTNIYDYLVLNQYISHTRFAMPYGAMILSFSQAISILMKFSESFGKNEELTSTLKLTNFMYSRFVPPEFIQILNKADITEIRLGDQVEKEMTVLFSDIRSYTEYSENLTPEENFLFLNSYLQVMTPIIQSNNGFIDKYIGDSIMALFDNNPKNAIQSAIKMQISLSSYNKLISRSGLEPIRIGIGIHTGNLILGTIGSPERMESTVVSDSVNIASRIESLTKIYGSKILISFDTFLLLDEPEEYTFRILDRVKVKGKKKHISIVEILDGYSSTVLELYIKTKSLFENSLKNYLQEDFVKAKEGFKEVLEQNPFDRAADLYLEKSEHYSIHGLPPEWIQ